LQAAPFGVISIIYAYLKYTIGAPVFQGLLYVFSNKFNKLSHFYRFRLARKLNFKICANPILNYLKIAFNF